MLLTACASLARCRGGLVVTHAFVARAAGLEASRGVGALRGCRAVLHAMALAALLRRRWRGAAGVVAGSRAKVLARSRPKF